MNYFDKIEAYTTGTLSEVEYLIFEAELVENSALQQELEGFQLAQSLFDFAGEQLSEEEITTADSVSLAEALFDFTANNLSEEQILAINTTTTADSVNLANSLIEFTANNLSEEQILTTASITAKTPIIRTLQPRTNRTAWLAAASMLFILSLIGPQFYSSQNLKSSSTMVAEAPAVIEKTPIKAIVTNYNLEEVLVINIPKKETKKNYAPAKISVTKKRIPIIAGHEMANFDLAASKATIENPLAMNEIPQNITTGFAIPEGTETTYRATNSITLTEGFSAKPGANFTAETAQVAALEEVNSNTVISEEESVSLKANKAITLKAGFHAKAGASFKAAVGK